MSSQDLQAVVKTQKAFIKELLDRLEGKTKSNDTETEKKYEIGSKKYSWYEIITLLCNGYGNYFNGLTLEQILELAKKSIRLSKDNCDMTHKLEDLLEKAKINGDNYYVNEITAILKPQDF